LLPGQKVAIELRLPNVGLPVHARAQVRYQDRLRYGLQFVGLSLEQREKIRYWSSAIAPIPSHVGTKGETSPVSLPVVAPLSNDVPDQERRKRRSGMRRRRFYALAALIAVLAGFGWWRWQNAWNELEMDSTAATDLQNGFPLRVSPDTMDRQIVYKVDPVYPDAARQAGTQGLVVLDAVIAQDGTVRRLHPVAGPRVLAQSAVDAVRSWKYTPYRSGGQAVEVATTVSVDFRLR
jgi:TonB family protein